VADFSRCGTKSNCAFYMVTLGYVLDVCVQNDAKEGYGILQYKNGERYEGQWRANFANGTCAEVRSKCMCYLLLHHAPKHGGHLLFMPVYVFVVLRVAFCAAVCI
jgi:hypothetical protein